MSESFTNDVIYHVVCQINMSDLMMNIQTCATDNTTYIMLYFRLLMNVHTCVTDNTTDTMVFMGSICQI